MNAVACSGVHRHNNLTWKRKLDDTDADVDRQAREAALAENKAAETSGRRLHSLDAGAGQSDKVYTADLQQGQQNALAAPYALARLPTGDLYPAAYDSAAPCTPGVTQHAPRAESLACVGGTVC